MCNMMFHCGCSWPWDGASERCNIYDDDSPSCPFCSAPAYVAWLPQWGGALVMCISSMLARFGVARVIGSFKARGKRLVRTTSPVSAIIRILLSIGIGIGVYYAFGILEGYVFKVSTGYPYFL
jgi:hypothetical protein